MSPFLFLAAGRIFSEYKGKLQNLCIVLPNKRGALFLKKHLNKLAGGAIWVPTIVSIEEFAESVSGLVCPDSITLTVELYNCWITLDKHKEETFQDFVKWSNTVLQDFNELDRHLVNAEDLFRNLDELRHIENWSLNAEPLSEFQERYLSFMEDLGELYDRFKNKLLVERKGWQGLAYRHAVENLEKNQFTPQFEKIIFCGFNALNKAEQQIFSRLKKSGKAEIIWDLDEYYFNDPVQEAGNFLRKNFQNEFLRSPNFISNDLLTQEKDIEIIGTPRGMGQVMEASACIKKWSQQGISKENMALILADETLLFPMLSVMPDETDALNITLEYPLHLTAIYDLYEQLLQIQLQAETKMKKTVSFYFKDLYRLFYNPCFRLLMEGGGEFFLQGLIDKIKDANLSFVSASWMISRGGERMKEIAFVFEKWTDGAHAISVLKMVNERMKEYYLQKQNRTIPQKIELEFIFSFSQALNRLDDLIKEFAPVNNLRSVYHLLREVVSEKTVPFFGEPLAGLQMMGVLETRTLDFENVIVLGMNEGILPAGKGGNSFIPWDLKKHFGLPLSSEKDAVYAYHFYKIIQRAKNVCLVYNTETDAFGSGEKSRFLSQLEIELPVRNPAAKVTKRISGGTLPVFASNEITIPKDQQTFLKLEKKCLPVADKPGLSPSSLNLYRDCRLKFWFKYVASVEEEEDVEENMEAGTFGSILHGALENLYRPFLDQALETRDLNISEAAIDKEIRTVYAQVYQEDGAPAGKNLIAVSIIQVYVKKMLEQDKKLVAELAEQKKQLKIIGLEKQLDFVLSVQVGGKEIPVKISGKCDRLDLQGEFFRIVDYKSSVKDADNFVFRDFENLFYEKGNNKLLQLFVYAWLAWKNDLAQPHYLMPCIIPFKNYSGKPERVMADKKQPLIFSAELLLKFEEALKGFVASIFNPTLSFDQTTDTAICEYCGYNLVCGRD
jgi:ATP-dependent helicase/nuclease subunit B